MLVQRLLGSFSRYALHGFSAAVMTWLIDHGADPSSAEDLVGLLSALVPSLLAVIWSIHKNKNHVREVRKLQIHAPPAPSRKPPKPNRKKRKLNE